jgi:hypothetical protein
MPGNRGGRRKGTPGKGYTNRTDLSLDYAPSTGTTSPASGGIPPAATGGGPTVSPGNTRPLTAPEDIPKLDDPTGRPHEKLTTGLTPGRSATQDPTLDTLRRAYATYPTPELAAVIRLHVDRFGKR